MGEWRYSSTVLDIDTRWRWSASRPGRFTPGEIAPSEHLIGGWVGPRAGSDTVEKRKISFGWGEGLCPLKSLLQKTVLILYRLSKVSIIVRLEFLRWSLWRLLSLGILRPFIVRDISDVWEESAASMYIKDGGSELDRKICKSLPEYKTSHLRIQQSSLLSLVSLLKSFSESPLFIKLFIYFFPSSVRCHSLHQCLICFGPFRPSSEAASLLPG
jgi:hypothetical protein